VDIGASAGGFEAFVKASPSDKGLALALVQDLDPGHQSLLPKLLSKSTTIPVCGSGRRARR
jgi:two-component system CheB/CheR fusion protein